MNRYKPFKFEEITGFDNLYAKTMKSDEDSIRFEDLSKGSKFRFDATPYGTYYTKLTNTGVYLDDKGKKYKTGNKTVVIYPKNK